MIPWWLCILAFLVGISAGGFIGTLLQSGARADEMMEQRLRDMRRAGW